MYDDVPSIVHERHANLAMTGTKGKASKRSIFDRAMRICFGKEALEYDHDYRPPNGAKWVERSKILQMFYIKGLPECPLTTIDAFVKVSNTSKRKEDKTAK